ncbi:pyrroline-5-carboxylate reductase [Psychromicrobium silvestre]|uniref:Pyrroline-5-carboxylate reductase n=1 Tax=Psychromicrobium silvestre TaxID=1645614 RepID=A0A7Y9S6N4_9MICC|nr:pyrroline-5-carboxylate reductase [Psychromicrobium silvestre]NYE95554.1 pyrroline-5-carboxylate reductase [Psychromicrobium silvestre]
MINRIAFLGCGSMGEAILAGLLAGPLEPAAVVATVRRAERAEELALRHGVTAIANSEEAEANSFAVAGADVVVLGVKPAQIAPLCREIAGALGPETVVLSVAGAVTLEQIERELPAGQPVVRTMPNTPLMVGRGVVALSLGSSVSEAQAKLAHQVFAESGVVLQVPEEQLAAIGAISGSGPAYAFYLAEAMATAARDFGLDEQTARILANETVAGAGLMLAQDGADATALRKAVTSPKGTTEQAIAVFDAQGLPGIVLAGAQAAARRSEVITAELQNPSA